MVINQTQRLAASINKYWILSSAILKVDNTATSYLICPEINIAFPGKSRESLNPQV
jgi:hypothetical protein